MRIPLRFLPTLRRANRAPVCATGQELALKHRRHRLPLEIGGWHGVEASRAPNGRNAWPASRPAQRSRSGMEDSLISDINQIGRMDSSIFPTPTLSRGTPSKFFLDRAERGRREARARPVICARLPQ